MIDRTFRIINKCIADNDEYELPVEEGIVHAYEQHVAMRDMLKDDDYNENETVLKELDEYYLQRFGKNIPDIF